MKLKALDPFLYPLDKDSRHEQSLFVDRFYDLINALVQPPYAISIDGLWGTGKTTLMLILQDKLKKDGYPVFWFNPWEYTKTQNVVLAFLQCLAAQNQDILENKATASGLKMLRVLLELGLDVGVKAITKGNFSLKIIKEQFKEIEEGKKFSYQKYQNPIQSIKKEFAELINRISKKHCDKPVIIFFDDLDRCLPDDTIELLEALKNLFVTPECKSIFICGIDTHIAKRFIVEHYKKIGEIFAINYFRKIFNLTISMPYRPDLSSILLNQIKNLFGWGDEKAEKIANMVYARSLQAGVNSVRKHLNIITNIYAFFKFNPGYDFNPKNDFVINLLVLKEVWEPLYEEIKQEALREKNDMKNIVQAVVDRRKNENNLSVEQEKFLVNYCGENSEYGNEFLSQWLVKYPTLA
jgi:nucleoside-triphosphatase THEP1